MIKKTIVFTTLYLMLGCSNPGNKELTCSNPILSGFYPDPSLCRVENDYFLVTSTFSYFPGIPVFKSRDLVNWKIVGHVMDRPEQMDLTGLGVSRGIFAPSIRYHDGIFYVTCTLVDAGGNFIVHANAPEGPWSNPVWIPEINGIDPSLFFDDDGTSWILYNSIPPDDKPLYNGHRTLRMYEFDIRKRQTVGEEIILVNGGTDFSKKPVWIEGPHIFRKDGYYFLIAAEGGTGGQHSEVVFRSRDIKGPYESYSANPVLTQRHLDPKRKNPVTSTGHADMVETQTGQWWAVFLGCRTYAPSEEGHYNTGRETFLAPVSWKTGWPVINPDFEEVRYAYSYPLPRDTSFTERSYGGDFTFKDDFNEEALKPDWQFLRTPKAPWYDFHSRKGSIGLQLQPATCADSVNCSFLGHRQQHIYSTVTAAMEFTAELENEKAGLLIFQNEKHFYFLCKSLHNGHSFIQLFKSEYQSSSGHMLLITEQELSGNGDHIFLQIESRGNSYSFRYSTNNLDWQILNDTIDARYLSTRTAGGFVGCMYALYATSTGITSDSRAYYDWFTYSGNDEQERKTEK